MVNLMVVGCKVVIFGVFVVIVFNLYFYLDIVVILGLIGG